MATRIIVLDFKQQPEIGSFFKTRFFVNSSPVFGGSDIDITYGSSEILPNQMELGADLNETINNTLAYLESNYGFGGSIGGFSTTMAYARVDNAIKITLTTEAAQSSVWESLSSSDLLWRTDTPCETYLLTNLITNAVNVFNLPTGIYQLKNDNLNTYSTVGAPSFFNTIFPRGFGYRINGQPNTNFKVPSSVTQDMLTIYFAGNTLFVIIAFGPELQFFWYSIDGITWQEENSFPDLAPGSYTVYIKDEFNCVKTFAAVNSGSENENLTTPYVHISETNSIRMVRRVTHGNCGNYKNVFNTLSCEENTKPANKFTQKFQSCDTNIVTQIQTSYENVEVVAGQTEIVADMIVRNIGIEDKRDANYYNYNGNLAVYFLTGNTYEYDTTTVTGTYALNGQLPEYGRVGNWVETPYGSYQITDIRIADDGQRSLILNSNVNVSATGTIQTIYNRENYNIWEFPINMADFINAEFTIGMRFYMTTPDVAFPDVFYVSERISVKERWANTLELVWSNSENTDVYFFSGIQMKNRLEFADINEHIGDGEVLIQKTDTSVIPIDATSFNGKMFEVNGLTTGMVRKIERALKHDNLIIENVPYALADNPSVERIGKSNFYKLTAKLLETGDVWNQGAESDQSIYSDSELIGLLSGDGQNTYIRIT